MILSQPVTNIIRFDEELELIKDRKSVDIDSDIKAWAFDGINDLNEYCLGVKIKFRLIFYLDKHVDEVVGFLSETESIVLESINQKEDLPMMLFFVNDIFDKTKKYLKEHLPVFDLNGLKFPRPLTTANELLDGLIELGLYK